MGGPLDTAWVVVNATKPLRRACLTAALVIPNRAAAASSVMYSIPHSFAASFAWRIRSYSFSMNGAASGESALTDRPLTHILSIAWHVLSGST